MTPVLTQPDFLQSVEYSAFLLPAQHCSLSPLSLPLFPQGGVSAMAWSAHGYQLLVGETGQARCLYQLEFARHMQGAHRVVQQAVGAGGGVGPGLDEVQALQVGHGHSACLLVWFVSLTACVHGLQGTAEKLAHTWGGGEA